jgi:hypothetical protein
MILLRALSLFAIISVVAVSCAKNPGESSLVADANGFVCPKCNAKFYTPAKVYAEKCPQCQSTEVTTVVGFQCYKDKHVTLTPRGPKSIACEKCQELATGMKMPQESELKTWGAVAKTKAEVGAK